MSEHKVDAADEGEGEGVQDVALANSRVYSSQATDSTQTFTASGSVLQLPASASLRRSNTRSSSVTSSEDDISSDEDLEPAARQRTSSGTDVPLELAPTPASKSRALTRRRSALMESTQSTENIDGHSGSKIVQDFASWHLVDFVQRMLREVEEVWDLTPYNQELETVAIFLDVSGFTKLTERLSAEGSAGSEKLGFFLNRYFERINKLLGKGGGDIMKFAGDAMLVFWQPEYDDKNNLDLATMASKATQAGLQLQEELHGAELAAGVQFSIKIGIGVGKASILHVGGEQNRIEIVPCGEALLQAFAGENQSEPGQTIVSPEVWALIQDRFDAKHLPSGSAVISACKKRVRNISIKRSVLTSNHEIRQLQRYVPAAITPFLYSNLAYMAEVREVTTIFLNLGFNPHDLVSISQNQLQRVQAVFRSVQREAYRVEASVNKFLVDDKGTTVLLALGLPPLSHENDPARGIAFALRTVKTLRDIDSSTKRYIGVTTGTALCGPVGSGSRKEYTLLGDSVNVSARFMQAANKSGEKLKMSDGFIGRIVCDETTRVACEESAQDFIFHSLGGIELKGKNEAVQCYQPGWAALESEKNLVMKISANFTRRHSAPAMNETWRHRHIDAMLAIDNFFCSRGRHPSTVAIFSRDSVAAEDTMHQLSMHIWEELHMEPHYVLQNDIVSVQQLHGDLGKLNAKSVKHGYISDKRSKWLPHASSTASSSTQAAAPSCLLLRTKAFLSDSLMFGAPVADRMLRGILAFARKHNVEVDTKFLNHPCFKVWPKAVRDIDVASQYFSLKPIEINSVVREARNMIQAITNAKLPLILTLEDAHFLTDLDWKIIRYLTSEFSVQLDALAPSAAAAAAAAAASHNPAPTLSEATVSLFTNGVAASLRENRGKKLFPGVFFVVSLTPKHPLARRPSFSGLNDDYVSFMQAMRTIVLEDQPLDLLQAHTLISNRYMVSRASAPLVRTLHRITGGNYQRMMVCIDALRGLKVVDGLPVQTKTSISQGVDKNNNINLTRRASQNSIMPELRARLISMSYTVRLQVLTACGKACNTRWEAQVLDHLQVAEKFVLRCACVLARGLGAFGLYFDLGMLAAVFPFKDAERDIKIPPEIRFGSPNDPPVVEIEDNALFKLEARLQRLQQMGIIIEVPRPEVDSNNASFALQHEEYCPYMKVVSSAGVTYEASRGNDRCYRFCDIIMRDKTYREILLAHRTRFHQSAIGVLESWSECISTGPEKLERTNPLSLQINAMLLFHHLGAKQLQQAHETYFDGLKLTLEMRLPALRVEPNSPAGEQAEATSSDGNTRKKMSSPRISLKQEPPPNESRSMIWASMRRPSLRIGDLTQSFIHSNRRSSGHLTSTPTPLAAVAEDTTSQFVETLRSIRQSTRRASILRAPSIRATMDGNLKSKNASNEERMLNKWRRPGSASSSQDAAKMKSKSGDKLVKHYQDKHISCCIPFWRCMGPGATVASAPLDHVPFRASQRILARLPSMNRRLSKSSDEDWEDDTLEGQEAIDDTKENLYSFMRRFSRSPEPSKAVEAASTAATAAATAATEGGGGFRMRGMRWTSKPSSSRNENSQSKAHDSGKSDGKNRNWNGVAMVRSSISSMYSSSGFSNDGYQTGSLKAVHALYMYAHPVAVDAWSRRMNFHERDAMSSLALQLDSWSFDIFAFERVACGTPLHLMLRLLFLKHGFYELFEFDINMVDRFAKEIERLYPTNPYHNSMHAADVVQACHVFLLQHLHQKLVLYNPNNAMTMSMKRADASNYVSMGKTAGEVDVTSDISSSSVAPPVEKMNMDRNAPRGDFSKVDRLVMLIAAAVHDVGHPGVNAGFLKATNNEICKQFSDPILENFHAATARPLIEALLQGELTEVRLRVQPMITRLVLATSVENHGVFVEQLNTYMDSLATMKDDDGTASCASSLTASSSFKARLTSDEAGAVMMEVLIKCADVSNCARDLPTYKLWVTRITEEFMSQTELEKHVGVPVTSFMASFDPQMQLGFINNIAFPLYDALARLCPAAMVQRDLVLSNYTFYQRGSDKSSPGISRTEAVLPMPSVDIEDKLIARTSSRQQPTKTDNKYCSDVLKRSASNVAFANSAVIRSSTASMRLKPRTKLSQSSSALVTTNRMPEIGEVSQLGSSTSHGDLLQTKIPGMVPEDQVMNADDEESQSNLEE